MSYQLAQANYARMLAPLDDPIMHGFVSQLDAINQLADETSGFVWRLKTELGDATALRPFDDDMIIFNMSVWESVDALFNYTYYSAHTEVYKARKQWFEKLEKPILVLWWIPEGHIPTIEEAIERYAHLEEHGVTPYAFTFKQRFTLEEFLNSEYAPQP